jgi:2-keto-3-deoxy-L-rhamnonate aldolase RhmA
MVNKRALNLKKKLRKGEFCSGIWITLPCPTSCEIIADVGFDWVMVDAEHDPFNPETLLNMAMAFKGSDTVLLIRIPEKTESFVKQVLDMGWDGIIFPQTNTLEDAKRVVSLCKYPPLGKRGYGPSRVGNYGKDEDEYVKSANDSVICVIQIENVSGAEQIEKIVQVQGIDWIMVGPNDMSHSAGRFRDKKNPVLVEALSKIRKAANAAGIPFSMGGGDTSDMIKIMDMGCPLVFLGKDTDYLQAAANNALEMFRKTLQTRK